MFMGTYYNSIDSKNRMIVPSKHRLKLGETCILTIGIDTCLYVYPQESWDENVKKIETLPVAKETVRRIVRNMFRNAAECDFDKQGRIIIPAHLKEYARLDKELVTMGVMDKIEVWAKEVWEASDNRNDIAAGEYEAIMAEYGF